MAKKIPVYEEIYSSTAVSFVNSLNEAERFGEDIEVRISTNGGDTEQGFAMLITLKEFKNKKSLTVDGRAYSMGAFMCLYADESECYDVSQFMLHRASYGKWYEESEYFTDSQRKRLETINDILKKRMIKKLDIVAFEKIAKISIDEFFEGDQKDIQLTASEAKRIGLVSNVKKLDSVAKTEINSLCVKANVTAMYKDNDRSESPSGQANSQSVKINNKMTIEKLKKEHPEVVTALRDEFKADVEATISAWAEWKDVNATSVIEGITSLKAPTAKDYSKFQKEMAKSNIDLKDLEKESPEATGSDVPPVGGPGMNPTPEAKSGKDLMASYLESKGL